jgi:hypothetical protein
MNHGEFPFPERVAPLRPRTRRRIDWTSKALVGADAEEGTQEEPRRVVVARGPRWETVDLRRLYTTMNEGTAIVSLLDVWVASGIRGDLFEYAFEFLDGNGRPASRRGESRLESAMFSCGWLSLETRDVIWLGPDAPPEHWHMKGISAIVAVKAGVRRRRRPTRTYGAEPAVPAGSRLHGGR